jgi:hypothetical protein
VDDFMARSKAAIEALPLKIGDWEGTRLPLEAQARDLLKPNAECETRYVVGRNWVDYSVIQAADSRFMTGHAPMNCYVNGGCKTLEQVDRVWKVGEFDIKGVEYVFERPNLGGVINVRNFFIFPDGHFGATLKELDQAAADYRKLKYGVVQVQVITPADISDAQRNEIFKRLVGSERSLEMIRILRTGIPK